MQFPTIHSCKLLKFLLFWTRRPNMVMSWGYAWVPGVKEYWLRDPTIWVAWTDVHTEAPQTALIWAAGQNLASQVDPSLWVDEIHRIPEQRESVADAASAGHASATEEQEFVLVQAGRAWLQPTTERQGGRRHVGCNRSLWWKWALHPCF